MLSAASADAFVVYFYFWSICQVLQGEFATVSDRFLTVFGGGIGAFARSPLPGAKHGSEQFYKLSFVSIGTQTCDFPPKSCARCLQICEAVR